jgi:hypothetical protein
MTIEVRDSATLRRCSFTNPNGSWPPDQRAADILKILRELP